MSAFAAGLARDMCDARVCGGMVPLGNHLSEGSACGVRLLIISDMVHVVAKCRMQNMRADRLCCAIMCWS